MNLAKLELNQYEDRCLRYAVQHDGIIHSANAVANGDSNNARYTAALASLTTKNALLIKNKTWILSPSISSKQRQLLSVGADILSQHPEKTEPIVKRALRTGNQEQYFAELMTLLISDPSFEGPVKDKTEGGLAFAKLLLDWKSAEDVRQDAPFLIRGILEIMAGKYGKSGKRIAAEEVQQIVNSFAIEDN